MGRIISGGSILDETQVRQPSTSIKRQGKKEPVSQEEGTLKWLGRNVGQELFRESAELMGLPGEYLRPKVQPEPGKESFVDKITSYLPTTAEIQKYAPIARVYPGDEGIHQALSLIPMVASSGLTSLPKLLKGAATAGTALLASKAGGGIGESLDEALGTNRRLFEGIGSLGGAHTGIKTAQNLSGIAANYPTSKLTSLAEEGLAKKEVGLKKSYEKNYLAKRQALEAAKNPKMNAKSINKEFNRISNSSTLGGETSENRRVGDILGSITNAITNNEMTVQDAIKSKKTLNKKLREQALPPVVKDAVLEARNILSKTIDEEARKNNKWGTVYRKAEAAYKEHSTEFKPKVAKEGTERASVDKLIETLSSPMGKAASRGGIAYYLSNLLGADPSTKTLLTLGTAGASELGRQGMALQRVFKNDRPLWNRWVKAVKKSAGGKPDDLVAMIPFLDSMLEQQEPEKKEKTVENAKKGRIISGGLNV